MVADILAGLEWVVSHSGEPVTATVHTDASGYHGYGGYAIDLRWFKYKWLEAWSSESIAAKLKMGFLLVQPAPKIRNKECRNYVLQVKKGNCRKLHTDYRDSPEYEAERDCKYMRLMLYKDMGGITTTRYKIIFIVTHNLFTNRHLHFRQTIKSRYKKTGNIIDLPHCGRPKLLSRDHYVAIDSLMTVN